MALPQRLEARASNLNMILGEKGPPNRTNRTKLLGLSASLLAGSIAGMTPTIPVQGQHLTKVLDHKI